MPAHRHYQHVFQDASWGNPGLLNVDIPMLPNPKILLGQTDPALLRAQQAPHHPYLVEDGVSELTTSKHLVKQFFGQELPLNVPRVGLIALGAVLLLGAAVTGGSLWEQAGQTRHVFQAPVPFVVNAAPMALAAISGAPATASPLLLPDTAQLLQEAQSKVHVLYGRDDPFSPLVSPELPVSPDASSEAEAPKMPVLSFVGIIEGASGTGRLVAILKSTGDIPTTFIKEPGDRFEVDGHRVMLKRVSKREVSVVVDGLVETMALQEYTDNAGDASGNGQGSGQSSVRGGSNGSAVSSASAPRTSFSGRRP